MKRVCEFFHGLKPALLMVVVQIVSAGLNIIYKLAANDGMSPKVIVAYRFIFATAFMIPLALIFERNTSPKLTWMVVTQAFLCGLFGGSLAQNLFVESLKLTTATFVSAMSNLVPAITLILGILFGLERIDLASHSGIAKVMGTLMGIGGAMMLTFYQGPEINIWSTHVDLLRNSQQHGGHVAPSSGISALGSLLVVITCFSYALWLIIQAKMSIRYPCPYWSTALMCIMGSIQSVIYALCAEKDWTQWKLGWDIRLLTVAYSGIVASGLMVILISWCLRIRGPLFVSSFNPLILVFVAITASLVMNEKLHLGCVLGGTLICCGLYAVLWGTSKEIKKKIKLLPSKTSQEAQIIGTAATTSPPENQVMIATVP